MKLIEVERDAEGHVLICSGCWSVETLRSIKARKPKALSCCPERKMVRAMTADDVRDLVKEAADHIDGVTGARSRPGSDSGELVSRLDAVIGRIK